MSGAHRNNDVEPKSLVPQWQNLFSFRFWIVSLLGAALVSTLTGLDWLTIPLWFAFAGYWLFFGKSLYCPACRKRIKMGADRCHHCGYEPEYTGKQQLS
jgi:hypothetical protein